MPSFLREEHDWKKKNTFTESLSFHRKGEVLALSWASALVSGMLPDGVGFLCFRPWGLNCHSHSLLNYSPEKLNLSQARP